MTSNNFFLNKIDFAADTITLYDRILCDRIFSKLPEIQILIVQQKSTITKNYIHIETLWLKFSDGSVGHFHHSQRLNFPVRNLEAYIRSVYMY